ncbi:asparagine synthase (glutamine-hydrolyzing) [Eubacterium oxidoreducens]|uniref:asparagine synthase (glutamine-hydrolyzing) n=1 Tax=Eubacterium oxidoreducens TaxID=1732 RepID=A0A1G6AWU0_EUBOX|nr:asparagine synthase (glutamine-hydrolyzing) [Eubacterium oxidoreducens]SDB12850.1 asparagine synthase (glutamine-hydrolysing) [Eubacterium oxidoreducens]
MCGICGFSGARNTRLLHAMTNTLIQRGPDDCGFFESLDIQLGVRRLIILDKVGGRQPFYGAGGKVVLIFNGEIYNAPCLRKELMQLGVRFSSDRSDTEVLLQAYLKWGRDFVLKLNGMFAIAIWDKRSNVLLLYRDRLGAKPLYYSILPSGALIFASQIRTLFAHPDTDRTLDDMAIYQYFSFKNTIAPSTAYSAVKALLPGQELAFENNQISLRTYWSLSDCYARKETYEREKLRNLLEDAVKIRLNSDAPQGLFLSGGLDSALIASIAGFHGVHLDAYTLQHDNDSDISAASSVASMLSLSHHIHSISGDDVISSLDEICRIFFEPFSGPISTYFLSAYAASNIKVALSGDGADELFGGYLPHILALPMQRFAKQIASTPTELGYFHDQIDYLKSLYEFTKGDEALLAERMTLLTDADKKLFLSRRMRRYARQEATLHLIRQIKDQQKGHDVFCRSLEYDGLNLLPNQVLHYSDHLSMAHSLEVRSPFLDYRLVEYVASLDSRSKADSLTCNARDDYGKRLMKELATDYLPKRIVYRKKAGFVQPNYAYLTGPLKEFALDTLSESALIRQDYLSKDGTLFLLKTFYDNPSKHSSLADIIWNFLCFMKWLDTKNED